MIAECEYETETSELKYPVMVHFLSAVVAVAFIACVLAITKPHGFLTFFLIYISSALGIPMIPVLIWTAAHK